MENDEILCWYLLDDIIKKNRGGPGNRRGRGRGRGGNAASGGVQRQQRGGANRGSSRGRIGKANNNRGRGGGVGGGLRRGGGRNSFNQGNNNRSNKYATEWNCAKRNERTDRISSSNRQQRGNGNSFSGLTRRNKAGDKPTATVNPFTNNYSLLWKSCRLTSDSPFLLFSISALIEFIAQVSIYFIYNDVYVYISLCTPTLATFLGYEWNDDHHASCIRMSRN